jgi:hypothetical protein
MRMRSNRSLSNARARRRLAVCVLVWLSLSVGAEVLYERALAPEERARYRVTLTEQLLERDDAGLERARARAASGVWERDWGTLKVEWLPAAAAGGAPRLRVTSRGEDLERTAAERVWAARVQGQPAPVLDDSRFKATAVRAGFVDPHGVFVRGAEYLGVIEREFEDPGGGRATVSVFDGFGRPVEAHELLRPLLAHELELRRCDAGPVVLSGPRARAGGGTRLEHAAAAWLTPDGRAVFVHRPVGDVIEFANRLRGAYPSGLNDEFAVDRSSWLRAAVPAALAEMQLALEDMAPRRGDAFLLHLGRLLERVLVPEVELSQAYGADRAQRAALLDRLRAWWMAWGDRCGWDVQLQRFVADGQAPALEQQRRAEAARQQAEAVLDSPLSPQETAALTARLIAEFERRKAEETAELRSMMPDVAGQVSWTKTGAGLWVLQWPSLGQGPVISHTFRGPDLTPTGDRETPLRARFSLSVRDAAEPSQARELSEDYFYYRALQRWSRTPPAVKPARVTQ